MLTLGSQKFTRSSRTFMGKLKDPGRQAGLPTPSGKGEPRKLERGALCQRGENGGIRSIGAVSAQQRPFVALGHSPALAAFRFCLNCHYEEGRVVACGKYPCYLPLGDLSGNRVGLPFCAGPGFGFPPYRLPGSAAADIGMRFGCCKWGRLAFSAREAQFGRNS